MKNNLIKSLFKYVEPLYTGNDGKMSLKASLAIMFSINFIHNLTHAIWKWEAGKSLEGLSLVLGIEAGLVISLLGLTAYTNVALTKDCNKDKAE